MNIVYNLLLELQIIGKVIWFRPKTMYILKYYVQI